MTAAAEPQRRAIGIIRVSQTSGREGERFVSPDEQRERIESACARDGLNLVHVYEEMDVSGGRALTGRPGLSAAVDAIEAGTADVVAAAYFDRLFRSLQTQAEVIDRVERAGGQVLAVDIGQVTNGSAGQWLSGTMMGAVSEYYRRSIRERSAEGQARAIARGVLPCAKIPLGYLRRPDGTYEVCPITAPLVLRAFQLRAEGVSPIHIRDMLREHGVERSYSGVRGMLASRIYIGELHFGKLVNINSHEAIVDRALFDRAQRAKTPRGPAPKSERLLARLRVLVCGTCGSPLGPSSVKMRNREPFPVYSCQGRDCGHRVSISARVAEAKVSSAVRDALRDAQGRASMADSAQEAVCALETAQSDMDAALRVFALTGAENESAAVERITELKQARDDAQARLDKIGPDATRIVGVGADWDELSLDGRRALIRATVESAIVAPGVRGGSGPAAERIRVTLVGQ